MVFTPISDAADAEARVARGDRVRGGSSVVAVMPGDAP